MKIGIKLLLISLVLMGGCHSDIYTKRLAVETLKHNPPVSVINGYLDLRYTENKALGFSLFESLPPKIRRPLLVSLQLLSTIAVACLLIAVRKKPFVVLLPLLLILSGALGNAWDRLRYGFVVDFIHLHIGDRFSWPIFNIADILIAFGVGLLLLQTFLQKDETILPLFRQGNRAKGAHRES